MTNTSALTFGIGSKFGSLTVVKFIRRYSDHRNHTRILVRVKCECGKAYNVPSHNLTRGTSRRCRECSYNRRAVVKIGQRYDKLIVAGFIKGDRRRRKAKCRCDCGKIVFIRPHLLRLNLTNNCGCRPRGRWVGVGNVSGTFMHRIRRNAKIRGRVFNLPAKFLWRLFLKQNQKCALTGLPIIIDPICKTTTASLDRKNSLAGYSHRNVQWVHKDINLMKMDFPQSRFVELCKLVYIYMKRREASDVA